MPAGRDVKRLEDLCLDALTACTEAEWFQDILLPQDLADRLYTKLQKLYLINDRAVLVVLHARSHVADLAWHPITDSGLVSLRRCVNIKKLCLSPTSNGVGFSEKSLLEAFECFHKLEWLELVKLSGVSPNVMKLIAEQNEKLAVLKLSGCENIDDSCLELLGRHCPHLRSVHFSSTKISHRGVAGLVKGACKLTLEEFIAERCPKMDDAAMSVLVNSCPSLRIVSVQFCPGITGEIPLLPGQGARNCLMFGILGDLSCDVAPVPGAEEAFNRIPRRSQLSWFFPS